MWGGHSCPPGLTVIPGSRIRVANEDQRQKRRTRVFAPHKKGRPKSALCCSTLIAVLLLRGDERHMDQMLAQEPHLQFVEPQGVADGQVIGAVVA